MDAFIFLIINICLFLGYCFGLGYTLTQFLKTGNFETTIFRIGLGLGTLPAFGVLLNALRIPLDWKIIFALTLIIPILHLIRQCLEKSSLISIKAIPLKYILITLIIIFCIVMYCYGPFVYPWLENDDSWAHASGIKYISIEKNFNVPSGFFHYIYPYPPGYDFILGLMHQTHPSLYWTLKFFNGFFIVLGILFFYIFAKLFLNNEKKALFATFILATLPCYFNHFIWAHSLVVALFYPAWYALLRSKTDKRFIWLSALIIGGILLVQPTQSIKFVILTLIIIIANSIYDRQSLKPYLFCLCLGLLISSVWWGPIFKNTLINGTEINLKMRDQNKFKGTPLKFDAAAKGVFEPTGGTATRAYKFIDYIKFPGSTDYYINAPLGMGTVIFAMAILGLALYLFKLFKRKENENRSRILIVLLWFAFTFLGVNSETFNLPVGLVAFRFWLLLSIPVAFFCAESFHWLTEIKFLDKKTKIFITGLFVFAILGTAGFYKLVSNTSYWKWGIYWRSPEEMKVHLYLRKYLPTNTKVFSFTDNALVIGHDMRADYWSNEYKENFQNSFELSPRELHTRLRRLNYEYLIISQRDSHYGYDNLDRKLQDIENAKGLYKASYFIRGASYIFRLLK